MTKELLTGSYLAGAKTVNALIKRLKNVAKVLSEWSQDDHPQQLTALAKELAAKKILTHRNDDVRVLAACALADVLRLFAPTAPYKDDVLKSIFRLILSQLQKLSDVGAPLFEKYFYVLEVMATVKSFLALLDLDDADDLVLDVVRTMFALVVPEHSNKMVSMCADVVCALLEESDAISTAMLDAVLMWLVPVQRNESPAAARLAERVVQQSAGALEEFIRAFFNDVMVKGLSQESELKEHMFDLVFELHMIAPSLLLYVLPQFENELRVEDDAQRLKTVRMLGRIFAQSDAALSYSALFDHWLSRLNDKAATVRDEMLHFAQAVMPAHPGLAPKFWPHLERASHDLDPDVRRSFVLTVGAVACEDLRLVNEALLRRLAERMLDKKAVAVRKAAMEQLVRVFVRTRDQLASANATTAKAAAGKLAWMPAQLLASHSGVDSHVRIEMHLNNDVLPRKGSAAERALELARTLALLDEGGRDALWGMLRAKYKMQQVVRMYLGVRAKKDAATMEARMLPALLALGVKLPGRKGADMLAALHAKKDNHIFTKLARVCTPSTPLAELRAAIEDLEARWGHKSAHYELFHTFLARLSMSLVAPDGLAELLARVQSDLARSAVPLAVAALELIEGVCTHVPPLATAALAPTAAKLLGHKNKRLVEVALHIAALTDAAGMAETMDAKKMCALCMHKTRGVAERAVELVCRAGDTARIADVYTRLYERLQESSATSPLAATTLHALSVLTRLAPSAVDTPLIKFVVKGVLMKKERTTEYGAEEDDDTDWGAPSGEAAAKLAALDVLVEATLQKLAGAEATVKMLVTILGWQGAVQPADVDYTSPLDRQQLRLGAACGLLRVAAHFDSAVTMAQYHDAAWMLQDSRFEVRQQFGRKLAELVRTGKLGLRWAAVFVLSVMDPEKENRDRAENVLGCMVAQMRAADGYWPEYLLPYFIHLLAHHSDLQYDGPDYAGCAKYLSMALQVLASPDADNMAHIKKYLHAIKRCKDAQDAAASNDVYMLCDMMTFLLDKRFGGSGWDDGAGDATLRVHMPATLFVALPNGAANVARNYCPLEFTRNKVRIATPRKRAAGVLGTPHKRTPAKTPKAARGATPGSSGKKKKRATPQRKKRASTGSTSASASASAKKTSGGKRKKRTSTGSTGSAEGAGGVFDMGHFLDGDDADAAAAAERRASSGKAKKAAAASKSEKSQGKAKAKSASTSVSPGSKENVVAAAGVVRRSARARK